MPSAVEESESADLQKKIQSRKITEVVGNSVSFLASAVEFPKGLCGV